MFGRGHIGGIDIKVKQPFSSVVIIAIGHFYAATIPLTNRSPHPLPLGTQDMLLAKLFIPILSRFKELICLKADLHGPYDTFTTHFKPRLSRGFLTCFEILQLFSCRKRVVRRLHVTKMHRVNRPLLLLELQFVQTLWV